MSKATRNIEPLTPDKQKRYAIIIPAAGCGYRLNSTEPKCMINVGGQTIIHRQLQNINSVFPKGEIIIVTGHRAEYIEERIPQNIKRVRNNDFDKTNVIYSVGLALEQVTCDAILVIYGDLVFNKTMINLPFGKESSLVISKTMSSKEIGVNIEGDKVVNLFYELPHKWSQISYYTGKELVLLREIACDVANKRMYGFECINRILDMGGKFKALTPKNGVAIDIDTNYDISLARKNYASM